MAYVTNNVKLSIFKEITCKSQEESGVKAQVQSVQSLECMNIGQKVECNHNSNE